MPPVVEQATMQPSDNLPPVGAIVRSPHWPDRVRVVRVEPRGSNRVLIEAVTPDGQSRLVSRLLKREDLDALHIEAEAGQPTLQGNPTGFRLAAEATRIRLAYTHDPHFAVSVARIDPLPHFPPRHVKTLGVELNQAEQKLYEGVNPAHRLPGEEVVPQVRYRVAEQGWSRVAESGAEYG